jgi:hypothetical protein
VESSRNGTGDGSRVIGVVKILSSIELNIIFEIIGVSIITGKKRPTKSKSKKDTTYLRSTRGKLNNDGSVIPASSLETSIDSRRRNAVYSRNSIS